MAGPLKLGVLISGNGSNLQSIIDHIEQDRLNAVIRVVISNNPDAYGITRAERHGIPCCVFKSGDYKDKDEFDHALIKKLQAYGVELVVLAGFMRIITPTFLQAFPGRVMNIHPALLPSFPGLHAQKQALEYGVRFSGCTVHFVDEGVDTGPIILQSVVPVYDEDTEETLAARILKEEHKIYPQAIGLFANGKLEIRGRRVLIKK